MDDLRDLLHNAAEEMRVPPEIPPKTLRRAKRRRVLNATLTGALTIAVIGAGFLGTRFLTRPATQELAQGMPSEPMAPPAELASFVDTFMQARFTQQGVEDLMAKSAVDAYNATPETGLSLFRSVEQKPDYQIASWEERGMAYSVQLRIDTSPAPIVEELKVGPGTALTGTERALVVLEAKAAPKPSVQVLNGTDQNGLAAAVAEVLETRGYKIANVGNAAKVYPVTTIFYRADSRRLAEEFATSFSDGAHLEPFEDNVDPGVQIILVVGKNDLGRWTPTASTDGGSQAAPIKIQLLNGTDRPELLGIYRRRLRDAGFAVQTGAASRNYERTTIFGDAGTTGEIADSVFRGGARVEPAMATMPEGIDVVVVLGVDQPPIASHLDLVDELARRFLEARFAGDGAHVYMSESATADFDAGREGLTLYPPSGTDWLAIANQPIHAAALRNGNATVAVTIVADRDADRSCSDLYFEQLIVSIRQRPVTSIDDLIITGATGPGESTGTTGDCGSQ